MIEVVEKQDSNTNLSSVEKDNDIKKHTEDYWSAICFISTQNRFFVQRLNHIL